MAGEAGGDHARRRHSEAAGARARHGAAAARLARSIRQTQRNAGAAEYVIQPGRRAHRESCGRRLLHVLALRDRCAGRGAYPCDETRIAVAGAPFDSRPGRPEQGRGEEGRNRVLKKRGRIHRGLIVLSSAGGSIAHLVRGLWRSDSHQRWLLPLAIFLCLTGLVLVLATAVEALAPFIYTIW